MSVIYLAPTPTGDDSRTYAQAQNPATPWATVAKVNSSATSGDTVSMAAGTYAFSSATFSKSFTWNGAALSGGFPTTILDGGGASATWGFSAQTITLSKITIQNIVLSSATPVFHGYSLGTLNATNCVFKTLQLNDANAFLFREIVNGTLVNCAFYATSSSAHATSGLIAFPAGLTMANCIGYFTETSNYLQTLIHFALGGTITIKNTIMQSATASMLWRSGAGSATWALSYSCMYGLGGSPSGTGVITTDPKFIDPTNVDFHLAHDSPALGMGTN